VSGVEMDEGALGESSGCLGCHCCCCWQASEVEEWVRWEGIGRGTRKREGRKERWEQTISLRCLFLLFTLFYIGAFFDSFFFFFLHKGKNEEKKKSLFLFSMVCGLGEEKIKGGGGGR